VFPSFRNRQGHVSQQLITIQTLFAVPMTCESCVKDISSSLYKLGGIQKVEANLKEQLVSIEGTGSSNATSPGLH
jgi:copper chaperone CopZ